jgi:hypothetical protein
MLGIPFDSKGAPNEVNLDPRSVDFQNILQRLKSCQRSLALHQAELKEAERYQKLLHQLELRALSLIAKAMRDLLDNTTLSCNQHREKRPSKQESQIEQQLESAYIYSKFRGLGFRMRELNSLLRLEDCAYRSSDARNSVVADIRQHYVLHRNNLLSTFLKESVFVGIKNQVFVGGKLSTEFAKLSMPSQFPPRQSLKLCQGIRQIFSLVLRITQLEQHLFNSLFKAGDLSSDVAVVLNSIHITSVEETKFNQQYDREVLQIMECVGLTIEEFLRPLIIAESNVDELCRIIITLNEDIRNQFHNLHATRNLIDFLSNNLDQLIFDVQERLSYCIESFLRLSIQMFEPLQTVISYPEILQQGNDTPRSEPNGYSAVASAEAEASSRPWYPPVRDILSLLSKIYGIVDVHVFDDFAQRSIQSCIQTVQKASELIKRRQFNVPIHGDLFLVRCLLILREQLSPFEIKLHSVEKSLDFKKARLFLNNIAVNPRNVMRFDVNNSFVQLVRDGLPTTLERQVFKKIVHLIF